MGRNKAVACWLLALWTTTALADVGGYQLVTPCGVISTEPMGASFSMPWDKLPPTDPKTEFKPLAEIISRVTQQGEAIARLSPDPDATEIQREEAARQKQSKIEALAQPLPGQAVSASVEVLDVVPMKGPKGENTNRVFVVGRVKWQSATVLSAEQRHRIAAYIHETDRATALIKPGGAADHRADYLRIRDAGERQLRKEIRVEAEAVRPIHVVYCRGEKTDFADWKKGQTRNFAGVIQSAGLFAYNAGHAYLFFKDTGGGASVPMVSEDASATYIGTEFVLNLAK